MPGDPVQEGKAIVSRDADLGQKINGHCLLTPKSVTNKSLNTVKNTNEISSRHVKQPDSLLTVKLADRKKVAPAMHIKSRRGCAQGKQGIQASQLRCSTSNKCCMSA